MWFHLGLYIFSRYRPKRKHENVETKSDEKSADTWVQWPFSLRSLSGHQNTTGHQRILPTCWLFHQLQYRDLIGWTKSSDLYTKRFKRHVFWLDKKELPKSAIIPFGFSFLKSILYNIFIWINVFNSWFQRIDSLIWLINTCRGWNYARLEHDGEV